MITGKWLTQGESLDLALCVRQAVFGQGLDEQDAMAQSVVVFTDEGQPAGAARLYWRDGAFRTDYLGVAPALRGKGYGDLLMRLVIYKAQSHAASRLVLTPTKDTRAFFARYGFEGDMGDMALSAQRMNLGCGH